jgi:hypothetical protein
LLATQVVKMILKIDDVISPSDFWSLKFCYITLLSHQPRPYCFDGLMWHIEPHGDTLSSREFVLVTDLSLDFSRGFSCVWTGWFCRLFSLITDITLYPPS